MKKWFLFLLIQLFFGVSGVCAQSFELLSNLAVPLRDYSGVNLADLNNDGNTEIIFGGSEGGFHHLYIYEWSVSSLTLRRTINTGSAEVSLLITDLDGDNLLDLLCSSAANSSTTLYRNLGNFDWSPDQLVTKGGAFVLLAELNFCATPELIIGGPAGIDIYSFQFGNWVRVKQLPGKDIASLIAFDLERDGDEDLLVSWVNGNNVSETISLRNDQDFNFSPGLINNSLVALGFGDEDSDGDFDLLVSPRDQSAGSILMNNSGVFLPGKGLTSLASDNSWVIDLDLDGQSDALLSGINLNGQREARIINHVGTMSVVNTGYGAMDISDFDHDGDVDLLFVHPDEVKVFRNVATVVNTAPAPPPKIFKSSAFNAHVVFWEDASDALSGAALSYDVSILAENSSIFNPSFNLISGERLRLTPGNNGINDFIFFRSRAADFVVNVQAVDQSGHSKASSIASTSMACTDFREHRIPLSESMASVENGENALWFSFRDGFLTETAVYTFFPAKADTLIAVGRAGSGGCQVANVYFIGAQSADASFPSLFSPNNDGSNDRLKVLGLGETKSVELKIFNREGNLVFASRSFTEITLKGWDGTSNGVEQPVGVYYWIIKGETVDGTKILLNGDNTGHVMLIR